MKYIISVRVKYAIAFL